MQGVERVPRRVSGGQSTALLPHQLETRKKSGYRGPSQPVIPRPINRAKKATGAWLNGLGFTIKLAGGEAWVTGRAGCLCLFLFWVTNNLVIIPSTESSPRESKIE